MSEDPNLGVNPYEPGEFARFYAPAELEEVVGSPEWQQLGPNYPVATDLHPRDLSAEQLDSVVSGILDPSIIDGLEYGASNMSHVGPDAFQTKEIPGVGTLEKIGNGTGSVCYSLTTPDGMQMAVKFGPYDPELGVQVPPDPRLSLVRGGATRRLWNYSDLRTYLYLPLTNASAVIFEELGQPPAGKFSIPGVSMVARMRALRYMRSQRNNFLIRDGDNTHHELQHPRHLLSKPGHFAPKVIDVQVIEAVG